MIARLDVLLLSEYSNNILDEFWPYISNYDVRHEIDHSILSSLLKIPRMAQHDDVTVAADGMKKQAMDSDLSPL